MKISRFWLLKKICILIFITLFYQSYALAQPPRLHKRALKRNPSFEYLAYTPQNYDPTRKYPLFVAIHWNTGTARQQYEQWSNITNREYFIMLCPQFQYGYQWLQGREDRILIQMMDQLMKEFKFDKKKVYLVGFSGGAQFVHRFAFKHPTRIKVAGVLAGGNYSRPPGSLLNWKIPVPLILNLPGVIFSSLPTIALNLPLPVDVLTALVADIISRSSI